MGRSCGWLKEGTDRGRYGGMDRRGPRSVALACVLVAALSHAPAALGAVPRTPVTARLVRGGAPGKALPALAEVGRDDLARALARGRIDEATYALERARSLFDLAGVRARYGDVAHPDPRAATLILRDLVLRLGELTPTQRATARRILARPTDGAADPLGDGYAVAEETPVCTDHGCVHYVASTEDAPDPTDADPANGVPDFVDRASETLEAVWAAEVTGYGYRAPKSDATSTNDGGDGRLDVYLANLGDDGLYGYCTTDDPNAEEGSGYGYADFSAYCVLDDDYAEFPPPSDGIRGLRVTMAHEFFHAVQFAYDAAEDAWFMESTAAWMEDEVYDRINDNRQYLPAGALGRPRNPLDLNRGFGVYGSWIWPRFLSEDLGDPDVIRRAWKRADASPRGSDAYSLQAYAGAIGSYDRRFRWVFADFGMVNAVPAAFYEEGRAYPAPPEDERVRVTRRNGGGMGSVTLDHLTNAYVGFVPGRGVPGTVRLTLSIDGPPRAAGTEASVVIVRPDGRVRFAPLAVDRRGDTGVTVPFGRGSVARVVLVMTNASMRRAGGCWQDPKWRYSCAAYPRDEDLRFRYRGELIP
ncbi:MAG: hypothetical protein KatS3mg014_0983 [Actinomycetota bacterium]|nr:MAG: hypothetical protein KatS3mg014_0983 [Actinomycetota bacterium]